MQTEAFFFLNALTYNPREFGNLVRIVSMAKQLKLIKNQSILHF